MQITLSVAEALERVNALTAKAREAERMVLVRPVTHGPGYLLKQACLSKDGSALHLRYHNPGPREDQDFQMLLNPAIGDRLLALSDDQLEFVSEGETGDVILY